MNYSFTDFFLILCCIWGVTIISRLFDVSMLVGEKVKYSKKKKAKMQYKAKWKLWQRILLIPSFYAGGNHALWAILDNIMLIECIILSVSSIWFQYAIEVIKITIFAFLITGLLCAISLLIIRYKEEK